MSARRFVHALVTGVAVASASAGAFAADVQVPEGCGDAASFDSELRSRVGSHADGVLAKTHVRIDRDADAYRLSMRVGDEIRVIRDPSCRELFVAAVVVAAAFADGNPPPPAADATPPNDVPSGPPVSATPAPPTVPPKKTETGAPLPASSSPPPASSPGGDRVAFGIGAGVGTSFGFLPAPSVAAELVASLHVGPWGVGGRGRYYASSEKRDAQGRGVSVQAAGAELSGSWTGWDVLELRAGVNVRAAFGDGIGSPATNTGTAWSVGALAGVRWRALTLGDTSLVLGADGTVDATPPTFEIVKYGEVFHAFPVDAAVFLGVEHLFR